MRERERKRETESDGCKKDGRREGYQSTESCLSCLALIIVCNICTHPSSGISWGSSCLLLESPEYGAGEWLAPSALVIGAVSMRDPGAAVLVGLVESAGAVVVLAVGVALTGGMKLDLFGSAGIKDEPDEEDGAAAGMKEDLPVAALGVPRLSIPFGLTSSS